MVDEVEGLLNPHLGLEDGYIDSLFDLTGFEHRRACADKPQNSNVIYGMPQRP